MTVRFRRNVVAMRGYVPGEQPPTNTRLIKLNTNENPYPPSPGVIAALRGEIEAGDRLRLYSDPSASALRHAAAAATGVRPEQILAGNGSDELLAVLARALVGEGDAIAFPYPTYLLYETMGRIQGADIHRVDFGPDFALPEDLGSQSAPLTFVANPNAPSGTLYTNDELARLARHLAAAGGVLAVDEAYGDFAGQTALGLLEHHHNLVILRTLSKSHSLAGMRIGLLFGHEELIAELTKVKDSYSLDRLAIAAGAASLGDPEWTADNTARIVATRKRLVAGLEALGLAPLPSHANFVFVRMRSAAAASSAFGFLRERGILVRYFAMRLLDDGIRITVGTDEQIDALLAALREFLHV